MSNATRYYCTRESVKAAVGLDGSELDALVDSYIEAASESIERLCADRRFIPYTATKQYFWPQQSGSNDVYRLDRDAGFGGLYRINLTEDLIAVTSLTKNDDTATAISASNYYLEPYNTGPPYEWIEIKFNTGEFFSFNVTPQRAIRVTGRWGYHEDTKTAGALAAAISSTSATTLNCTDASLVGVGDTLLIDTEQLFVSGRAALTTTATLSGNPTAAQSDVTVGVNTGSLVKAGETILVDSEEMLVRVITGNNLTVKRAVNGTVLAAHTSTTVVYAYRTLTVVRGVNGTTAATHLNSTAVDKYAPPADVVKLCRAYAIANREQDKSGWTGTIGGGEAAVETRMITLRQLEADVKKKYRRWTF